MGGCSIRNCKSRSEKGSIIRFYSFPKKESVANEWLRYCGPKTTCKNGRVCSKHFMSSDYIKPLRHILMNESPKKIRTLKPDAIPTLHIDSVEKSNSTDLTAKSTVCTGRQKEFKVEFKETKEHRDNCETKENYATSAPSGDINLKAAIQIKSERDTTPTNNVEDSSSVVKIEESDKKITISESEYKLLKRKADEYEVLKNNLKQIFTSGQIRCLTKPDRRRVIWSAEDIAAAKSLRRSISPKAYRYLRATGIKDCFIPNPQLQLRIRDVEQQLVEAVQVRDRLRSERQELEASFLETERSLRRAADDATVQASQAALERARAQHDRLRVEKDLEESRERLAKATETIAELQKEITRKVVVEACQRADEEAREPDEDERPTSPDQGIDSDRLSSLEQNDVATLSPRSLYQENVSLKQKLARTKATLADALIQLNAANIKKKSVQRAICREFHKTQGVLRQAREYKDVQLNNPN